MNHYVAYVTHGECHRIVYGFDFEGDIGGLKWESNLQSLTSQ